VAAEIGRWRKQGHFLFLKGITLVIQVIEVTGKKNYTL
jgi:hypothetical protein